MQRHWRLQRQAEWRSEETKALASPLPGAEYSGTSPYKKIGDIEKGEKNFKVWNRWQCNCVTAQKNTWIFMALHIDLDTFFFFRRLLFFCVASKCCNSI